LANNGGPTQTMGITFASPAFNAGSDAAAAGLTTDQRGAGLDRIVRGRVDIGAFELQQPTTVYVDDSWAGTADGANPANDPLTSAPLIFGVNAFADIPSGLIAAGANTLVIFGGAYGTPVNFNQAGATIQINVNPTIPAETVVAINNATTISTNTAFQ